MSNAFEKLRQRVLAEVDKERTLAANRHDVDPARRLGMFLQAALGNLGISRGAFATRLDVERDYVDAILDGDLPASEIHGDLLKRIAVIVGYEPQLLRIMLGQSVPPGGNVSDTASPAASDVTR